jgi:hypothetical protein
MHNKEKVVKNHRINADIVCFRGVLKTMMTARYNNEKSQSWQISACKFKNTIYLTFGDVENKSKMNDSKMREYGFKFESYVFADSPKEPPKGSKMPVNEGEEFCVVMSRYVKNVKILFAAEIDGVESDFVLQNVEEIAKANLAEVKTLRNSTTERQMHNFFQNISLNWWCQSYLCAIDKIYVGFRSDSGIVHTIKAVSVDGLAAQSEKKQLWSKVVCIDFLKLFIERLQKDLTFDNPYYVFKYSWSRNNINVVSLEKEQGKAFLSPEYINFVLNL